LEIKTKGCVCTVYCATGLCLRRLLGLSDGYSEVLLISFMLHCKSYYQTFRPKSNIANKTCRAERHCWLHSSECEFCTCIEYHSSIWTECHGQLLSAPARVWDVMGLNIDLDTRYPDYSFLWLCLLRPRDFQHSNTE